jgi:RNA polymerase sigma-70 factor (ECF subfamily)
MTGAAALYAGVDGAEVAPAVALAPRLRSPLRTYAEEEGADEQLMARVRTGDAVAFERIVERYKDPLVGYLARMTNCRDRAEEYAQETFLRLYQNSHRYAERGHLSAYLYRIATNLLRSDERRRRRFRLLEGLLTTSDRAPEPSAQGQALHREATDVVSAAIHELPTAFRAPLVLREIDGWSYAEIALALGCRVGTVKSRINRAKARLRETLAPYWNGTV